MFPKVSILFPVYKTAAYLREALDSMLNQTFTDFELIVLDDCSPDNSPEILDTYTDSRIVRYRGEKNQGLANVLNVGLSMARGEYIARMDSDDISLPDRLKVEVEYLDAHPDIDLVSVGMQMFGANNRVLCHPESVEYVKFMAFFDTPILHASSMWRRERFADKRLFFRQNMVPAEDFDMWTRALVEGIKLINLPLVLYRYRIHPSQATASPFDNREEIAFQIRDQYVRGAFDCATEKNVFVLHGITGFYLRRRDWNRISRVAISENKKSCFFEENYFKMSLKRRYQDNLYRYLNKKGFSWRIVFLRPKQIVNILRYLFVHD